MPILTYYELVDIQQRAGYKVDQIMRELQLLNRTLDNVSNEDLEKIYITNNSQDPIADRVNFWAWQASIKNISDNYSGSGEILDGITSIQDKLKPSI